MTSRHIKAIEFSEWRQFDLVQIEAHPKLTILTGANGSGKTTILNSISTLFDWKHSHAARPVSPEKQERGNPDLWRMEYHTSTNRVGLITFEDGSQAPIIAPTGHVTSYETELPGHYHCDGLHIPAHRSAPRFSRISELATTHDVARSMAEYIAQTRSHSQGDSGQPFSVMKRALFTMALLGYPSEAMAGDRTLIHQYEGFQEVLRKALPPELGFRRFLIVSSDVALDTDSGVFAFDSMSGGLASLIDTLWQLFMFQQVHQRFPVTFDEPELHLHPALQRTLFPGILAAFPTLQFIVATHSPLVISSVEDSSVYALLQGDNRRISSRPLDIKNRFGTANDVLREALGVPISRPPWVEDRMLSVLSTLRGEGLTRQGLAILKEECEHSGLGALFPADIVDFLHRRGFQ